MPEHDVRAVASELDFELGEVARVQATEDSVLLRISGRWWSVAAARAGIVEDDRERLRARVLELDEAIRERE